MNSQLTITDTSMSLQSQNDDSSTKQVILYQSNVDNDMADDVTDAKDMSLRLDLD